MGKYSYEYIKEYVENFGYILLSTEYKNNLTKLLIKCPKGHEYEVSFSNFKNNKSGCPYCAGNARYSYVEVKEYIESFGYKLLSQEYTNAREKLKLQCPEGHIWEVRFYSFKNNGTRCFHCKVKERSEKRKHSYDFVKNEFEKEGYKLLSTEYHKNDENLLVECPKGHNYEVRFNNFKQGKRCPICELEKRPTYKKFSYEYVKKTIEDEGYFLLSKNYEGCYEDLIIRCPENHIYVVNFNNFKNNNRRCPYCNESKGEKRIAIYLNSENISFIPQHKFEGLYGVRGGLLSYDFYLPQYNILIEYQGQYHDGTSKRQTIEDFETQQEHDRRKKEYAKKNNYKLLEIWYWDFDRIEEILDNYIEENK